MLLKIYPDNPSRKAVEKVVQILKDGGVIIYPTDTVYAFGCDICALRRWKEFVVSKDWIHAKLDCRLCVPI